MAVVRSESRCRIGITWYATEQEADEAAANVRLWHQAGAIEAANIGFAQCGRAPEHDRPGEYAVITP